MHMTGWDIRYVSSVPVYEEALLFLSPLIRQRIRWTEGSLIRYLENVEDVIFNPQVAFRTKLDLLQFVFEFMAPLWLLSENLLMVINWLNGALPSAPVLYSASALLVLTFYFIWALYQGISKFSHLSLFETAKGIVATYFYLSLLWLFIVFFLLGRILFQKKRNLKWHKTERCGMVLK
jgi:cellulose synthase/poly-beta-1,6-N-acetylglucosamine synthase-like glycosyltransferase